MTTSGINTRGLVRMSIALWFVACLGGDLVGQVIVRQGQAVRNLGLIQDVSIQDEVSMSSSATLKTDPDTEAILEKAKRFEADGNYTVAAQLWQAVLERSGDTLYSADNKTYYSMVDQVEATLAQLNPEALKIYRINADAEAKQILARAGNGENVTALSEVVRRFFVSSVGDEAAYQLASIFIDRFDFLGALRLLEKIRDRHPDPSISESELYSKIAFCESLLGNRATAQKLVDERAVGDQTQVVWDEVKSLLKQTPDQISQAFGLMSLSTFRNYRVQPGLPQNFLEHDLQGKWQFVYEVSANANYNRADVKGTVLKDISDLTQIQKTEGKRETDLIKDWRTHNWRPNNNVLVTRERVYFKTAADLVCWPTEFSDEPVWRTLWRNTYEPDDATTGLEAIRAAYNNQNQNSRTADRPPTSTDEIFFFGDELNSQMTLSGNVIYQIEGKRFDESTSSSNANRRRGFQYNATFRRTRTNFLVAYEADTGRLLWNLPQNNSSSFRKPEEAVPAEPAEADAGNPEEAWLSSGGFMGAPIPFHKLLVVPVNVGGAIYVYGLDPEQQGKTVWKTYLCDEPESGAASWAPMTLSIDGSDLFVASGMGVVFVLDPATGLIRFAQRYERSGKRNIDMQRFGWQSNRVDYSGWREDVIIPYGRQMICFCSDTNLIFAIDRSSAQTIWQVEMQPLGQKIDYLIGIQNDVLFAGGAETIIAFDLLGEGRMLWGGDLIFEDGRMLGKAVLCEDGLYVPVDDSIVKLSTANQSGKPQILGRAHVNLGTSAPCGNLMSDGRRLWTHYANRLVALERQDPKSDDAEKNDNSKLDLESNDD